MYELMDTFQKYEQSLEQSCRKNERLFTDLKSELDAQMDLEIEVGGGQGKIPAQSPQIVGLGSRQEHKAVHFPLFRDR